MSLTLNLDYWCCFANLDLFSFESPIPLACSSPLRDLIDRIRFNERLGALDVRDTVTTPRVLHDSLLRSHSFPQTNSSSLCLSRDIHPALGLRIDP